MLRKPLLYISLLGSLAGVLPRRRGRDRQSSLRYGEPNVELFKVDRDRIGADSGRAGSALRLHELLQHNPFATARRLVQQTGLTAPTVNAALADLEHLGVVQEVTGRRRGRVFAYGAYLAILNEGAEPLRPAG